MGRRGIAVVALVSLATVVVAVVLIPGWLPAVAPAQAPAARTGPELAYVANEGTGTISVVDTSRNTIVTTICLGSGPAIEGTPQPAGPCNAAADLLKPFYNGHAGTHGLWLTPDGTVLLATNRLSSTVVAVDTGSNAVLGYAPVGREPHLATVRPGGREAWVAVRGARHLDVLSLDELRKPGLEPAERLPLVARILTADGPSMVAFTSDGKHAFVASGKARRVDKVDASARKVVASQTAAVPFTPFGLVTPDDQELYLVHKGAGTLSILRTSDLSVLTEAMTIGPRANHVTFVGRLAYITIGGPAPNTANPDPEGKLVIVDRATRRIVRELAGPAFSGDPHGIWPTSDGRRLYVGHERGNRVTVIDTGDTDDPNDDTVIGTVGGAAADLAHLKQPIDIVVRR